MLEVMSLMGFGSKWCKWIHQCISTCSLAVLINGSSSEFFETGRGLRQGEPLSPFLFIIAAEGLFQLFQSAIKKDLFPSLKVWGPTTPFIMQYADDTLLAIPAEVSVIKKIKQLLVCFSLTSGLSINFSKCELVGLNVHSDVSNLMASTFKCKSIALPLKYLGLPLGCNPKLSVTWSPIIDKISNRLKGWKGKMLSIGGRLTLVKSVLNSLPLYYLSVFQIPKSVADKINLLMRRFLWHGHSDRKICAVKWERTILSKDRGGLGIGSILDKNKSLLFKWIWNFCSSIQEKWKEVLAEKYLDQSNRIVPKLKSGHLSSVSRGILSQLYDSNNVFTSLGKGLKCKVGNGKRISFWYDWWIADKCLQEIFPRLYLLAVNKDVTVSDMGYWSNGNWYWEIAWRRSLFVWEKYQEEELLSILNNKLLQRNLEDNIQWIFSSDLNFKVKEGSSYLEEIKNISFSGNYSVIWKSKTPPKVQIFLWKLVQECIPTKLFLHSRSVFLLDLYCPFCNLVDESSTHIILHCEFAWGIWCRCLRWWGVQFVMPKSMTATIDYLLSFGDSKKMKELLSVMIGAICWTLWLERNNLIFEKRVVAWQDLFHLILLRTTSWIGAVDSSFILSINDCQASTEKDLIRTRTS